MRYILTADINWVFWLPVESDSDPDDVSKDLEGEREVGPDTLFMLADLFCSAEVYSVLSHVFEPSNFENTVL